MLSLQVDCLEVLQGLESQVIDLVITSPPYFQQRDYGNENLGIDNEKSEEQYMENILAIFF